MGEIAEMMLDGTLCAGCGEFMDFDDDGPQGFPGYCSAQCARDCGVELECDSPTPSRAKARKAARINQERQSPAKTIPCPSCGRMFAFANAVAQHARDKHGQPSSAGQSPGE